MFTLTNPSAITFPRFNADNTVTARTAANFRSDIGAGTVTLVTASGTAGNPISITNTTTTPTLELLSATTGRNGYLTSTDWTTFNGKQNALTLTTTGTSGASTLVGATLNIPQYTGGSGTVTNVSGTGAISVATGTTTPVISVADAAFGTAGIVTSSGTQQFSGDKVFEGISQFNGRAVFKDYTYVATRLAGLSSTDRFATVTIGSGLSLSSGTLSATGGGVTSVTASSPLSSSGGATPNITITDAGAAASGVVNTTTQSFAGNKTFTGTLDVSSTGTFGGRVKTNWLERNYAYSTSSSFTVSVNTTWQDINTSVLTTITLPNAATYPGKELHLRQTGAGSVQSASSNIIPFLVAPTGSTSNGILIPSGDVRAATLVSDGDNWIIMQRNN
jgi:trimeric autotransporter adhesin